MKYYHYELKVRKVGKIPTKKWNKTEDVVSLVRQICYSDKTIEIYESVWLLLLNHNQKLKGIAKIGQGGITGCLIDKRLVCKYAIESLSTNCILVHNHPSGNLQPSIEDKKITKKIKIALSHFDIVLLDHLIITVDSYYSFSVAKKL